MSESEGETERMAKLAAEEEAIKNSCNHIEEFLETIADYDIAALTSETRQKVLETQAKVLKRFSDMGTEPTETEKKVDHLIEDATATARQANSQVPIKNERKSSAHEASIIEVLADKLDNRKVPALRKFDEDRGELLINFFDRFEEYSKKNIKDESGEHWIDLLENYFSGETLEVYKCYRDTCKDYESLRDKMLSWHRGTLQTGKTR